MISKQKIAMRVREREIAIFFLHWKTLLHCPTLRVTEKTIDHAYLCPLPFLSSAAAYERAVYLRSLW